MNRFLLGILIIAVAVAASVGGRSQPSARADAFPAAASHFGVKFCAPVSAIVGTADTCAAAVAGTTVGNFPDIVEYFNLQIGGGAPGSPFVDVLQTRWDTNLDVSAAGVSIGAVVGELDWGAAGNFGGPIGAVSGAPPACAAGGGVAWTGSVLAAVRAPTTLPNMFSPAQFHAGGNYVQAFDDDDGDLIEWLFGYDANDDAGGLPNRTPETQEDGVDLNNDGDFVDPNEMAPNGIPDGADRMPDFIPRLLNGYGLAAFSSSGDAARAYTSIPVDAGGLYQVDVHFITLDLTPVGQAYEQIVILGSPYQKGFGAMDPWLAYNQYAENQAILYCPPSNLAHAIFGVTRDNPATIANEGGTVTRTFLGTVSYKASFSSEEDYDGDTFSERIDRCQIDAGAGLDGADGDGVSGLCDNNAASPDNCDGAGGAPPCALLQTSAEGTATGARCTGLAEAVGFEGGGAEAGWPWDLDQDVDCDGAHNFDDNCAVLYNPSQRDLDFDGVGNVCDPNANNGCGPAGVPLAAFDPCPVGADHDYHDHLCTDTITAGAVETGLGAAPPCGSGDSDDDGWHDYEPSASPPEYDINSDADFDGCSDKAESESAVLGGTQFCEGDPLDPDTDNNTVIDGSEDMNGDAISDWRNDVVLNSHSASNAPNNAGSPDSDGDGCSNRRENLLVDASGGNRNALNPYDFLDVPGPANGPLGTDGKATLSAGSTRNKAVALTDVAVILAYVGRTSTNAGAVYYNSDLNNDGKPDGRQMDRTAGPGNNETAGNLAVTLTDVGIALDHAGDNCAGTP